MKTIECTVDVDQDQRAILEFPSDVPPGRHHLVVTVDQVVDGAKPDFLEDLPPLSVGAWPEGLSLSREDMYGDNGR